MNLDHTDKFLVLDPKTKAWLPLFFLCTDYIFWVWVTWAWRWLSNKGAAAVQLICGGFQSHLVDLAPIRVRHCPARQSLLAFPLQASCTFNHTAERFLQGIWSRLGLANEEWQQEVRVIQLQKCCCTKSWLAAGNFCFSLFIMPCSYCVLQLPCQPRRNQQLQGKLILRSFRMAGKSNFHLQIKKFWDLGEEL